MLFGKVGTAVVVPLVVPVPGRDPVELAGGKDLVDAPVER